MTEPAAPAPASPPETTRISPVIPFTVAAGLFMEELDSSIIATSLPQMAHDFGVTAPELSMAVTSYLLALAVFLPMSGWIADRYGARRVFCTAIVIFLIGSLVCGFANSLPLLVAGRVIQGLGGSLMNPVGRLILVRTFPKHQYLQATNYMAVPGMLGPMLGPLVGGFITLYFSWRWNFFINIPVGIAGIYFSLRHIKDLPNPGPRKPFDWWGYILVATAMATGQMAVEFVAHAGGASAIVASLFTFTILAGGAYVLHWRSSNAPIIDLNLLKIRTFWTSVFIGGIFRIGLGGIPFLLPLMFQVGFGMNALHSGSLTLAGSLGVMVLRIGLAQAIRKIGIRRLMVIDAVLLAAIVASMGFFTPQTPSWLMFFVLFLWGCGRATQFINIQALAYTDMPSEALSGATTIVVLGQRFCISLGVAIGATLLTIFTGTDGVTAGDFRPVFLVLAGIILIAGYGFSRLKPGDGWQLSSRAKPGS